MRVNGNGSSSEHNKSKKQKRQKVDENSKGITALGEQFTKSAQELTGRDPDSKEPPDVYQMDFYPFGAASSPAVCSNALRQAVRDDGDRQL